MNAATKLLLCQGREPAFDEIDPGCAGGCEVHMESWTLGEPAADQCRLMRAVIVQNQVHFKFRRDRLLDSIQELPEFGTTMPTVQFADDLTGFDVERCEQRSRAMARIVVSATFRLSGPHREQRLGTVESLNLGLLVHAQDQSAIRWIQVKPNDIAHFLNEQRVFG